MKLKQASTKTAPSDRCQPLMTREARRIAAHAWRILPKKRGHLLVVYERAGKGMTIDSGTENKFVPVILWRALLGTAGLKYIAKSAAYEVVARVLVWLRIWK